MKKQHITLSDAHRTEIKDLLKAGQLPARKYKRALALLELDRGRTYMEVATLVDVAHQTVSNWASKYRADGLTFLDDKPRPGRPTMIDGLQRAEITALACSTPPAGYETWSLRLLADKAVELGMVDEISHTQVGEILKKTNSNRT